MDVVPPSRTNLLLVSAVALLDPDGRVLVQQRAHGPLKGLWEFPGGKIEPGETPAVALVRELREELGIDVEAASLAPAAFASEPLAERHLLLLLHICRQWRGEPRPIEAADLRWLHPAELHGLPMPAPDIPLIRLLEALV